MTVAEVLPKIALNLFHVFLVALLLISLAANLVPNKEWLAYLTYAIVAGMVGYHTYRISQKINQTE